MKQRVRQECPAIADWLNTITGHFGKLAAVEVKNEGRLIYRKGELLPVSRMNKYDPRK